MVLKRLDSQDGGVRYTFYLKKERMLWRTDRGNRSFRYHCGEGEVQRRLELYGEETDKYRKKTRDNC